MTPTEIAIAGLGVSLILVISFIVGVTFGRSVGPYTMRRRDQYPPTKQFDLGAFVRDLESLREDRHG